MVFNPKIASVLIGVGAAGIAYAVISFLGISFWTLNLILYLYPITSFLVVLLSKKPEPGVLTS